MTVTVKNFGNLNKGTVQVTQGNKRAITRFAPDYTGSHQNLGSEISVGLESIQDYMGEIPFVNQAKAGRLLWSDDSLGSYNSDGYPVTWDSSNRPSLLYARGPADPARVETFVFEWDGDPNVFSPGGNFGTTGGVTSYTDNRIEYTVDSDAENFWFGYDYNSGNNPSQAPVNFRLYRTSVDGSPVDDKARMDAGYYFRSDWIAHHQGVSSIRFMDWQAINVSAVATSADIGSLSHRTWPRNGGANSPKHPPLEILVAAMHEIGADGWFCIPHLALVPTDTTFIDTLAAYLRDNVNHDFKCKIEPSNELWNTGFAQSAWLTTAYLADGWTLTGSDTETKANYAQKLTTLAFKRFTEVFGDTYGYRLQRIIPGGRAQINSWNTPLVDGTQWEAEEPGQSLSILDYADYFSVAHYFGSAFMVPGQRNTFCDTILSMSQAGDTQEQINTYISGVLTSENYVPESINQMSENADFAAARGLTLKPYEGGSHIFHGGLYAYTSSEKIDHIAPRMRAYQQSADHVAFLSQMYDGVRALGIPVDQFGWVANDSDNGEFKAFSRVNQNDNARAQFWNSKKATTGADWFDERRPVIDPST